MFNSHNLKGIELMIRLCLGLSHLREHEFKKSFQDSIKPLFNCAYEVESIVYFFLHFPLFRKSTLHNLDSKLFDNLLSKEHPHFITWVSCEVYGKY